MTTNTRADRLTQWINLSHEEKLRVDDLIDTLASGAKPEQHMFEGFSPQALAFIEGMLKSTLSDDEQ